MTCFEEMQKVKIVSFEEKTEYFEYILSQETVQI